MVDTKIAVRVERNAIGSVVLDERSGGFTNQRGEDALIGVTFRIRFEGSAAGIADPSPSSNLQAGSDIPG
jgi:hypothetical protein